MDNIEQLCVICCEKKNLRRLNEESSDYADLMYRCFGIQFLDYHIICRKCVTRLKYCCAFRREVEVAHQKLYDITNNEEPYDLIQDYSNKKNITHIEESSNDFQLNHIEADNNSETSDVNSKISTKTSEIFTVYSQEAEGTKSNQELNTPSLDNDTTCPVCKEYFYNPKKLKLHYENHFPTHLCDECGQSFSKKMTFITHMKYHRGETHKCDQCQRTYKDKSSLLQHKRMAHLKENIYVCFKCSLKFRTWYSRQKHLMNEHGVKCLTYQCPNCELIFITEQEMRQHVKREHLKQKDYVCEICCHAFFTRSCLKKHMIKHFSIKNHKCKFCGKMYSRLKTLTEHLKIHLNIKKFKCEYCGKAFVQNCSLKSHIRTHLKHNN